jgi:hypothetical protein
VGFLWHGTFEGLKIIDICLISAKIGLIFKLSELARYVASAREEKGSKNGLDRGAIII